MASPRVFGTAELLESILLNLDMLELIRAQRVCKCWRDILSTSPQLQRRTFLGFVPKGGDGDLAKFVCNNVVSTQSPRQSSAGVSESTSRKAITAPLQSTCPGKRNMGSEVAVKYNPIFPSLADTIRLRTTQFRTSLCTNQSWLDMYLSQPPTSCVQVTLYYTRKGERRMRFGLSRESRETAMLNLCLSRGDGVRARDVLMELRHTADACDVQCWQRIDIRIPGAMQSA